MGHGSSQAFTITPDTNYHVADILVDGTSVGAVTTYTFSNVTSDHTISATFAIDTYTVTASAGTNGSISPSGTVTVDHGSSQTFTITPDTNYHIEDVIVDGTSVGAKVTYTFSDIASNHLIHVVFTIDTHNNRKHGFKRQHLANRFGERGSRIEPGIYHYP